MNDEKVFHGINWLRTIACIGIVLMHMRDNNTYILNGVIANKVIPSFTNFVFLFMVISSFGMCCGYYRNVIAGEFDLAVFYKKRVMRILPFFSCLVVLDLIVEFSKEKLFEAIADISLLYGLFPNNITVIGVGWFLGLIFAFYMIFPFFCVIIGTRRRAWASFIYSLILNYICGSYFKIGRTNIVYCLCFFILGGLVYLYRQEIIKVSIGVWIVFTALSFFLYYYCNENVYACLLVSGLLLIVSISIRGGYSKLVSFISGISMEIYLSHMVVFRIIERLGLNTFIGNGLLQYVITVTIVLVGTIVLAHVGQRTIKNVGKKMTDNNYEI